MVSQRLQSGGGYWEIYLRITLTILDKLFTSENNYKKAGKLILNEKVRQLTFLVLQSARLLKKHCVLIKVTGARVKQGVAEAASFFLLS